MCNTQDCPSNVKYVSKHLEIIGSLKDILMCTKKKTPLLKRQLEDAYKSKKWTVKRLISSEKSDSQSIPYFRIVMCKAPRDCPSNVRYVSNHLKRIGSLKDILLCTPKKNPLLAIYVD